MEKKSVRKITNSAAAAAAFYKSAGPNDERFYGKSMQKLVVFSWLGAFTYDVRFLGRYLLLGRSAKSDFTK